jgi:hypothetical protein
MNDDVAVLTMENLQYIIICLTLKREIKISRER